MRALTIIASGAKWGAFVGAFYFLADLLGTLLAIHFLFDPTRYQALLIVVALVSTMLLAMPVGVAVAAVWAWRRRLPISRRALGRSAAAAFVLVLVAGFAARVGRGDIDAGPRPPVVGAKPPAVLWIVLDTLRADTLYGPDISFPLAPAIGAFAQQATVFTDAESAAGWTIPATATLLTGFHPETLQTTRAFLPDWAPTVAERLRHAGYETHAVIDNAILEPRNGFAAGFTSFHQRSAIRFAFTFPAFRALPRLLREYLREQMPVFYQGAEHVTDAVLAHMDATPDAPLFAYVHYMDVHYPYYPHPEYGPDPDDAVPMQLQPVMENLRYGAPAQVTDGQLRFLTHRYNNELRYLDQHVGRLLSAWQERYGDNALVMITADHGEEFMEHGGLGHGSSLYKELVHVPLIIKWPARALTQQNKPPRVDVPVGSVNVLPTALAALGLPAHQSEFVMEGQNLLPFLQGRAPAPTQPLFASQQRHARRIFRVRQGNDVYIDSVHVDLGAQNEAFDKAADYAEMHNIATQQPALVTHMKNTLKDLLAAQEKARSPKPNNAAASEESLRALGYVQ